MAIKNPGKLLQFLGGKNELGERDLSTRNFEPKANILREGFLRQTERHKI